MLLILPLFKSRWCVWMPSFVRSQEVLPVYTGGDQQGLNGTMMETTDTDQQDFPQVAEALKQQTGSFLMGRLSWTHFLTQMLPFFAEFRLFLIILNVAWMFTLANLNHFISMSLKKTLFIKVSRSTLIFEVTFSAILMLGGWLTWLPAKTINCLFRSRWGNGGIIIRSSVDVTQQVNKQASGNADDGHYVNRVLQHIMESCAWAVKLKMTQQNGVGGTSDRCLSSAASPVCDQVKGMEHLKTPVGERDGEFEDDCRRGQSGSPTAVTVAAPDGGWGWVVLLATIVVMALTLAFPSCVGIFYTDLQNDFHADNSLTSWVPSIMTSALHAGGKVLFPAPEKVNLSLFLLFLCN